MWLHEIYQSERPERTQQKMILNVWTCKTGWQGDERRDSWKHFSSACWYSRHVLPTPKSNHGRAIYLIHHLLLLSHWQPTHFFSSLGTRIYVIFTSIHFIQNDLPLLYSFFYFSLQSFTKFFFFFVL